MYKAITNFVFNGVMYEKGDDVKINTKEELIKLSERGFIKPLTLKDIQNFNKPKKIIKKEEE